MDDRVFQFEERFNFLRLPYEGELEVVSSKRLEVVSSKRLEFIHEVLRNFFILFTERDSDWSERCFIFVSLLRQWFGLLLLKVFDDAFFREAAL